MAASIALASSAIACKQPAKTDTSAPSENVAPTEEPDETVRAEDPPSDAWVDLDALLPALPGTLAQTSLDGLDPLATRIGAVPGVAKAVSATGSQPQLDVELATELDAARVVELLGWSDAHVISGDVHQRNWYIVVRTGDLDDAHGRRIATQVPTFAGWWLQVHVAARPEGPSPGIVGGASPAYPLDRYTAKVKRLTIRREP